MDLDTAANELYALSPDDFIERRQQLVAEARQARDRDLATQIGHLRRPTRTAWLINLLARDESAALNALFELGAALQDAQQRMAGDELRQLWAVSTATTRRTEPYRKSAKRCNQRWATGRSLKWCALDG